MTHQKPFAESSHRTQVSSRRKVQLKAGGDLGLTTQQELGMGQNETGLLKRYILLI